MPSITLRSADQLHTEGCAARLCNCELYVTFSQSTNENLARYLIFAARCGAPSTRIHVDTLLVRKLLSLDLDQDWTTNYRQLKQVAARKDLNVVLVDVNDRRRRQQLTRFVSRVSRKRDGWN